MLPPFSWQIAPECLSLPPEFGVYEYEINEKICFLGLLAVGLDHDCSGTADTGNGN